MTCVISLDDLNINQSGKVVKLLMPDPMKTRLQDLGMWQGTQVTYLHKSPLGDPKAFHVCGAVIALRKEDCLGVLVDVGGDTDA